MKKSPPQTPFIYHLGVFLLTSHTFYGITNTQEIYLQSGTDVQIASAWFAKTSTTMDHSIPVVSEILVTDYNIYLVNTTLGNTTDYVTVASSTLSNSNIEMIRYHAELSGTYRIIVYQAGNMHENNTSDWVYLNYNS